MNTFKTEPSQYTAWRARMACSLACATQMVRICSASQPQPPTHDLWRTRWQSGSANMSHHQPPPASNIRLQPVRVPAAAAHCGQLLSPACLRPTPLTIWLTRSARGTCSWTVDTAACTQCTCEGRSWSILSRSTSALMCAGKCPPGGAALCACLQCAMGESLA